MTNSTYRSHSPLPLHIYIVTYISGRLMFWLHKIYLIAPNTTLTLLWQSDDFNMRIVSRIHKSMSRSVRLRKCQRGLINKITQQSAARGPWIVLLHSLPRILNAPHFQQF